ncbi:endo alpha-1,4 polygalactosaminidase [Bradyrhizobium sp. CB1650]|uniref:endo alpha-1,4 polygalactosaminidase n=1 Tax=Bradyrhizobium sp. CB1650 TaxID=3039153 RepID=UPI002435C35E|nr:endo alpha-1,4 polygalactosaminidase [Bradyrhizobium sp. CB1650]WGD49478.1 endo alpha-1,4 polygalactosaminidase [Bradyrhizobium sp. CB1650]
MIEARSLIDRLAAGLGRPTRRRFLAAGAAFLSAGTGAAGSVEVNTDARKTIHWLAFYGVTAEEAVLATYDIVVLDPDFQGSIGRVADGGGKVCGYLSLAEIRMSDPLVARLDPAALLPENPDWPGTHRVDIRHPTWRSLILDVRVPALAAQGFTGLMFDALDTPPYLEKLDQNRYSGMRAAAIELVVSIRARWPDMMLIMNRGYALLPDLVGQIDAVIAESLMTSPGPRGEGFAWIDRHQLDLQLELLQPATRRIPPLPILSLDYWNPDDASTIAEIYRRERELGHHPYVATRSLDLIVPESR